MDQHDLIAVTLDITEKQMAEYIDLKTLIDNTMGHQIVGMPVEFDDAVKAKLLELAEKLPGGKFGLYLAMTSRFTVDSISQIQSP